MTTFKTFILNQFKQAGLAKFCREEIYEIGFPLFREAFTHKSFRPDAFTDIHHFRAQQFTMDELASLSSLGEISDFKNYNQLEFLGDKQLNTCIAGLLLEKYPNLSDRNLTFSFQIVSAEKYLGNYAKENGFFEHILMSPYYFSQAILWRDGQQEQVDPAIYQKGKIYNIYQKLLEDTCESFSAALVKAVDMYSQVAFGPGMNILMNWTRPILDMIDFDPMDDDQVQAIEMRMKELWEIIYAPQELTYKFSNHNMYQIDAVNRRPGHVPVKGVNPVTKQVIAEAVGISEQDAYKKVARLVVDWLLKNKQEEIDVGKQWKLEHRGKKR
jgi:dsRNA-specific ribonuclease